MRLRDKVAIVTGTASGIGRGTALLFGREGARVAGADIETTQGECTAESIRAGGGEAFFLATDVTRADQVQRLVEETVRRWGRIDVLFSNVGVAIPNALADVSEEEWDRVMDVNLKSMFLCSKYVLPHMMRAGSGSIILMSSGNGLVAEPYLASYCATKAAIIGLVRSIACDYGKYNIRCNCLCPTYTRTPLLEELIGSGVDPNLSWEKINRLHTFGRIGTVEEVANSALFLASDESSIVTGTAMPVDGGLTCFRLA